MKLLMTTAIATMCLLSASTVPAQDRCDCHTSDRTSTIGDARYEVLPDRDRYETYKLDRVTGEVSRLRRSSSRFSGQLTVWKALPLPPVGDQPLVNRVNYQLILNGDPSLLLVQIHTGTTWALRGAASDLRWEEVAIEK
jgi:hypothetical protein